MSKFDKFVLAFCIVFLMSVIVAGCIVHGYRKNKDANYSATMIVSEVSTTFDMVEITTSTNIHYVFEGVEDWAVGDFVAVTMNNNGTPADVTDDIIVNCAFAGTMESFDFVLLEKIER